MNLIDFLKADTPVRLGLWLGRVVPLARGRKIALKLGAYLASRKKNSIRMGILANQTVISCGNLSPEELDQRCLESCQSMVVSLFEYFYYYRHREELKSAYTLSNEAHEMFFEDGNHGEALLFMGPHLGNFDLLTSIVAACGINGLVLAVPSPTEAYKAQNKLRAEQGLTVLPMSLNAFRQARKVLADKGVVITGLDRPSDDPNLKRMPSFFGQPSRLPTFYEKLAVDSGAKIRIGAAIRQANGTYHVLASDPIYFSANDEADDGNIKKITAVIEPWIQQYATQWAIIKPLWPTNTINEEARK
jgi:KDO2-lipid IV(A) lauroyltransferase